MGPSALHVAGLVPAIRRLGHTVKDFESIGTPSFEERMHGDRNARFLDEIVRVGTKRFLLPVELGVHAEKGVVFDREGKLRGGYSLTDPDRAKLLQALIREVLAEKPATNEGGEGT